MSKLRKQTFFPQIPQMKQTIDAFSELAAEGEKKMAQIEKGNAQAAEFQKELKAGSQQMN